jgi:hypothetical protein
VKYFFEVMLEGIDSSENNMLNSPQDRLGDSGPVDRQPDCSQASRSFCSSCKSPTTQYIRHAVTGHSGCAEKLSGLDDAGISEKLPAEWQPKQGKHVSGCYCSFRNVNVQSGFGSGQQSLAAADSNNDQLSSYIHPGTRQSCKGEYPTTTLHNWRCVTSPLRNGRKGSRWLVPRILLSVAAACAVFYHLGEMGLLKWIPCYIAGKFDVHVRSLSVYIPGTSPVFTEF